MVCNLLGNALKFSHPGGRVTVRLAADEKHVLLSVTDNGIGIPADEQERVFARFFRSSLVVADEIQGTGLGLSLVQTSSSGTAARWAWTRSRARAPPSPCGCPGSPERC